MPRLQFLDLHHDNLLTGFLPDPIDENFELLFMLVHDNHLTGKIPSTYVFIYQLQLKWNLCICPVTHIHCHSSFDSLQDYESRSLEASRG
jgi:hypothetical protein